MGRTKSEKEPQDTPSLASKIEKTRTGKSSYVLDLKVNSPASLGYLNIDGIESAPAMVRLHWARTKEFSHSVPKKWMT